MSQVIQRFIARTINNHWKQRPKTRVRWVSDANIDAILKHLRTIVRHLVGWKLDCWIATSRNRQVPDKPPELLTSEQLSARRAFAPNDFAPSGQRNEYVSVLRTLVKANADLSSKKLFIAAITRYFDDVLALPCPTDRMWAEWQHHGREIVRLAKHKRKFVV